MHSNNWNSNSKSIQKKDCDLPTKWCSTLGTKIRWWTLPRIHVHVASPDKDKMDTPYGHWEQKQDGEGLLWLAFPPETMPSSDDTSGIE